MEKDSALTPPAPEKQHEPPTPPVPPAGPSSATPGSASRAAFRTHPQQTRDGARELRAQRHQQLDRTPRVVTAIEALHQHAQARTASQADQQDPPTPAASGGTTAAVAPDARSPLRLLLIEENPADLLLCYRALAAGQLDCETTVLLARGDVEAFVCRAATEAAFRSPHLIVLDYIIPGMAAEEIVAALRRAPALRPIPTVLFSDLDATAGDALGRRLGVTAFMHKPVERRAYFAAVQAMVRHWGMAEHH